MNWFQSLSLKLRILSIVCLSCVICSAISFSVSLYFKNQELFHGIVEKSNSIHMRLDAAAEFVGTQGGLTSIINQMKSKYKSSDEMTKEDKEIILKQVPIVAAMRIGAKDSEKDDYEFRVFSNEPRNDKNKASADELVIFNKFEADTSLKKHIVNNGKSIFVYRPVRLTKEQGCFNCHGDPATSPWGNGLDILGYKMENWQPGKLHGVFAIKTNIAAVILKEDQKSRFSSTTILAFLIIAGGAVSIFVAALMIKKPINILNNIAASLSDSGKEVSSTSLQIAHSSEELSQAANEQAASLQETSASLEEINSMINLNSENAKESSIISEQSLKTAERGREVIYHMHTAIEDINTSNTSIMNQIDETNKEIETIVKIINEIADKTKVINDIVFQTKLLSFNASVEAARAGEQGKGFAVVADEVGKLASMSGAAALEISNMLESSTQQVERIVQESKNKIGKLIAQGKEKGEQGFKVSKECEGVLNEIVISVASVSKMVNAIASASQEQAQGIQEITKAITQIDQVTQINTSSASDSANAAGNLSNHAEILSSLVDQLMNTIEGEKVLEKSKKVVMERGSHIENLVKIP